MVGTGYHACSGRSFLQHAADMPDRQERIPLIYNPAAKDTRKCM